ncbi:MAG: penicillin-binding protein activator [Pseudomonadota bacterium]
MVRLFKIIAAFMSTALFLVACDIPSGGPRLFGGQVKVGLLVPTGSDDARVNNLASTLVDAANLAISEAPNAKIQMIVYPTQGTEAGARNAARQAIAANVNVIIGPLFGANAAAVGQEVSGKNTLVLSFSNNGEIAGGNLFVLGQTFEDTATRLLAYAKSQGSSRALAVVPSGAEGDIAANAVSRAAANAGITYSGKASYPFSQEGVQNSATTIVNQTRNTGSDVVVVSANPAGALPLLAQSLGEKGFDNTQTQVVGLARWDVPATTLTLTALGNGLFALPNIQAATDFSTKFEAFAGVPPQLVTGVGYDAMKVVTTQALTGGSDALSIARITSKTFEGASGAFKLTTDRQTQRELAVAQVRGGSYVVVSQPNVSGSGS